MEEENEEQKTTMMATTRGFGCGVFSVLVGNAVDGRFGRQTPACVWQNFVPGNFKFSNDRPSLIILFSFFGESSIEPSLLLLLSIMCRIILDQRMVRYLLNSLNRQYILQETTNIHTSHHPNYSRRW